MGGSSVKDASQIRKVIDIVKSDKERNVVVVSAPGRDEEFDQKITDHLLNFATKGRHLGRQFLDISEKQSFEAIVKSSKSFAMILKLRKKR